MFSKARILRAAVLAATSSLICSFAIAQRTTVQPRNGNFTTQIVTGSPVTAQKNVAPPANSLLQHPVRYDTGGYDPFAVAIGDVDSDGKADLIVANQEMYGTESSVGILLGNGDGTFQTATSFDAAGELAYSVVVADVNADGRLDVLIGNGCATGTGTNCSPQGVLAVFLGNGDGTFQPAKTYSTGGSDIYHSIIAVADLNADHKLDVVVAHGCGGLTCTTGSVSVLLGDGTGGFSKATTYTSGGNGASSVAIADMNGDHKPDLLVANWCSALCGTSTPIEGSIGVLLNNGDGTFQAAVAYPSGGNGTRAVAVSDLNHDGKADVLTASCGPDACAPGFPGGNATVLLGSGNGTLQTAMVNSAGNSPDAVVATDINGDGKKDLIVGNWGTTDGGSNKGSITILLGSGDGTFHATKTLLAGGNEVPSVAVGDLNGDGHPDVVTADVAGTFNYNTNGSVSVFLNNQ